jgi:hypothetical protein
MNGSRSIMSTKSKQGRLNETLDDTSSKYSYAAKSKLLYSRAHNPNKRSKTGMRTISRTNSELLNHKFGNFNEDKQ